MLGEAFMERAANTTAYRVFVTVTSLLVGLALCAANSVRIEVSGRHLLGISGDAYAYISDDAYAYISDDGFVYDDGLKYRHRKFERGWPAVFLTHTQHERHLWGEVSPDVPDLVWRPIPGGWEQAVQSSFDADSLLLNLLFSLIVLVCTVWLVAKYGHRAVAAKFSLKALWLFMSLLCVALSVAAFEYSMGTGFWRLTASQVESHPLTPYRMYVSLTWRPLYMRIPVLLGCFCVVGAGICVSTTLIGKIVRGLIRRKAGSRFPNEGPP